MITFDQFFAGAGRDFLISAIDRALEEDGSDPVDQALFAPADLIDATLYAKQDTFVAGLPIIIMVFDRMGCVGAAAEFLVKEGGRLSKGEPAARIIAPAADLLQAERIMLNFICHMSGIANRTAEYVAAMGDSPTRLLDTRKTLPGLRYPEKYAVLVGGGHNHRFNLRDLAMLKDNHIDRLGGVVAAVKLLRQRLGRDCPDLEIECRILEEVREAVSCKPKRIMLDNMDLDMLGRALKIVPEHIESEVSGGVTLENIGAIAALKPDFISVGALTHSAPFADFSLKIP